MDIRKSQDRTADSVRQPVNRPRGGDFDTQHGAIANRSEPTRKTVTERVADAAGCKGWE
jgi:hypothetical protein